jgi:nitrite reductase (NO-forming)
LSNFGLSWQVHLTDAEKSLMYHSVDFHAATGPGGGAEFTQAAPGEEKIVTFKALVPGLFVYQTASTKVQAWGLTGVQTVSVPPGGAS